MTASTNSSGVLNSLRLYDRMRLNASAVTRREGSNLDHIITHIGEEIPICHLSGLFAFSDPDVVPQITGFEWSASVALAIHHLNTGNGVVVPKVKGLNKKCKIRFTTEFADTQYQEGVAMTHVIDQTKRELGSLTERNPCAFVGPDRSADSIPTSIVTGLLRYPLISPSATSVTLDDKSLYPLFGRTIPSDDGNTVYIIRFLREVLDIKHLAIINPNDSFGNNYAEGLRKAAESYAPDMIIHQKPLDEGERSYEDAIANVKETGYRFIFALVYSSLEHDKLLTEGYKQGIAGTGDHNWIFGDSFIGTLSDRRFKKGSILHRVYSGTAMIQVSGGMPGIKEFDAYQSGMKQLINPIDLQYLESMWPRYNHPNWGTETPFINSDAFLADVAATSSSFTYEATISLGLAACNAYQNNESFSGQDHYNHLKNLTFSGVSGQVRFDRNTGTRVAGSAMYKVTNYIESESDQDLIEFKPVVASIYQNNSWVERFPFIFNDGTSRLPVDIAPPMVGSADIDLRVVIGFPVAIATILIALLSMFYMHRQRRSDSIWELQHDDLKFGEPPKVIGQGKFGLVLLAEYRGTLVAVKRVIPPIPQPPGKVNLSSMTLFDDDEEEDDDDEENEKAVDDNPNCMSNSWRGSRDQFGRSSRLDRSGRASNTDVPGPLDMTSGDRIASWGEISIGALRLRLQSVDDGSTAVGKTGRNHKDKKEYNSATTWRKMKCDFIDEMQHLSKLRHPCITTIMGAVISNDPMIVLEYLEHGSLYDLLHNETMAIEGDLALPILRDISQGIRFLHSASPQVIHGDLKSANILVDRGFRAKVADFGSANQNRATGTPFWMAPELLRGETVNSAASDVYSFGIILYEVFSRRDPYENEGNIIEVLRLVCDKAIQKRPAAPFGMPEKVKGLMVDCVEDEPANRPTFEEIDKRLQRIDCERTDASSMSARKVGISLFDIFPRHVAEALRDGRTVEAEHKEVVTIFFSDIVGFTEISASLPPKGVADLLGRLYTGFDELSRKHDVFKVETIGDAYMAVTNLVKDQPEDHAKRIAEFAMDAIEFARSTLIDPTDPGKGFVEIRCGFHSGPVVADVVGTRNPRYCLFGDTVNTASRMESNSKVNRILCSDQSYEILKVQCPDLPVLCRGRIAVKGKGKMMTYWVNWMSQAREDPNQQRRDSCYTLGTLEEENEVCALEASGNIQRPLSSRLSVQDQFMEVPMRGSICTHEVEELKSSTSIVDIEAPSPPGVQDIACVQGVSAQDLWISDAEHASIREVVHKQRMEEIRKATERLNLYRVTVR